MAVFNTARYVQDAENTANGRRRRYISAQITFFSLPRKPLRVFVNDASLDQAWPPCMTQGGQLLW